MPRYCCMTCGKYFDPEKIEICPTCGAAAAPSVMTRVERKQTAARLRAEGMYDYDDHCHEDDAWKGSYGSQVHKTAVQAHEANLRAGYNAHSAYDVTNRGNPQPAPRAQAPQTRKTYKQPPNTLFRFLLPLSILLVYILFRILLNSIA